MRCVFSESMKDNALDVISGSPPGSLSGFLPGGSVSEKAFFRALRTPIRPFTSAVDDLVSTLFPADCRACGGSLLRAPDSLFTVPICDLCLARLRPQSKSLSTALCGCCGEALGMESDRFATIGTRAYPSEGPLCTPCRVVPPTFVRAVAYGVYENELREMLHLLKYDRILPLAATLGAKLAQAILLLESSGFTGKNVAVIAVPLFAANQRQRSFNQSILLADQAVRHLRKLRPGWNLSAAHALLKRIKPTESQFNLSPKGRRRNLIGAFEAHAGTLIGKEVLLLDDIYTTGATSRACAQTLRRAGAARVWVATLARAQRESVALWDSSADDFG